MRKLDLHTHSIASGHGSSDTIADMAKHAASKGLDLLGITDHGPATIGSCKPSYFRNLHFAPKTRCGISLLYGVELNILDTNGTVDLDVETLSTLDYAIASMHLQNIRPGSISENTQTYINAMKNPFVKILGHCDDARYPVDYLAIIQAAIEHNVIIELNNASLTPDGYRGNTLAHNIELLKYAQHYHMPILLSSDSHGISHIGEFSCALKLIEEVEFPKNLILNYDIDRTLHCLRMSND